MQKEIGSKNMFQVVVCTGRSRRKEIGVRIRDQVPLIGLKVIGLLELRVDLVREGGGGYGREQSDGVGLVGTVAVGGGVGGGMGDGVVGWEVRGEGGGVEFRIGGWGERGRERGGRKLSLVFG